MKKNVLKGLAMALSAALLTACGTSGTQTGESSMIASQPAGESAQSTGGSSGSSDLVMAWWGSQTRNERTQEVLDLYSKENPGVRFDGQFSEWSDYWNKLATSAAGKALPDIIQMDYNYVSQYVENDLLADLTPYIDSGVIDISNCNQDMLNTAKIGDGIYAICIGMNAPALLYNKTLLEENNIAIKDNMTMEEFIALSKEIYEKTGYKTNVNYGNDESYIEYFLRSYDVAMFEKGKMGGESPQPYIAFFEIYERGIKEGWHVEPAAFAERTIGSAEQDPLVYGSSPETMSWCTFKLSNQYTAYQEAAPEGMEIGLTTWPAPDPVKSNFQKPGQFLSISTDSKNPEEAAKVLNYFTNSIQCNEILLGERGVPLSTKVSEAILPKLDEGNQKVIQFINDVVAPSSSQINPPAPAGASEVKDLLNKLEEQVCYGKITAKEAGEQMLEKGNSIMASKAQ